MTRLPIRRVAILAFLAVIPLRTCFLFGQQHLLILFLLTLAARLAFRGRGFSSGAVLAFAAVLKVYPALFGAFFLFKGRWRALAGLGLTFALLLGIGAPALVRDPRRFQSDSADPGASARACGRRNRSIFRRNQHADPDLAPALRGRPRAESRSARSLASHVFGPPGVPPGAVARFGPLARAVRPSLGIQGKIGMGRLRGAADGPVHDRGKLINACILDSQHHRPGVDFLLGAGRVAAALVLVGCYAIYCSPIDRLLPSLPAGGGLLLGIPRFYALFGYWAVFLWTFARVAVRPRRGRWEDAGFVLAFLVMSLFGARSNLRHLRAQFQNSATRVPIDTKTFIATGPAVGSGVVYFSRMDREGYVLDRTDGGLATRASPGTDLFHPTIAPGLPDGWVEVASTHSRIARFSLSAAVISAAELPIEVEDAEQPGVSGDSTRRPGVPARRELEARVPDVRSSKTQHCSLPSSANWSPRLTRFSTLPSFPTIELFSPPERERDWGCS